MQKYQLNLTKFKITRYLNVKLRIEFEIVITRIYKRREHEALWSIFKMQQRNSFVIGPPWSWLNLKLITPRPFVAIASGDFI